MGEEPARESLRQIYTKHGMNAEETNGGTDNGHWHSYIGLYEDLLAPYREKTTSMVEIGVLYGASMMMWRDYFHNAMIYGVDVEPLTLLPQFDGVRMDRKICSSTDKAALDERLGDLTFDVIIDDGSHYLEDQFITFNHMFSRLRPGGIYIIEDIESIDRDWRVLRSLGGGTAQMIDLRPVKGRHDDVIVFIRKPAA